MTDSDESYVLAAINLLKLGYSGPTNDYVCEAERLDLWLESRNMRIQNKDSLAAYLNEDLKTYQKYWYWAKQRLSLVSDLLR